MAERTDHALPYRVILSLAVSLAMAPHALSQRGPSPQRNPHIGYVYPAGGQRGTELEITVGGQYLHGVSQVVFSGDGLEAAVVKHQRPLTPKQRNEIREIVDAARKRLQQARKQGKRRGKVDNLEAVIKLAEEMGADRDQLEAFAKFRRQQMDRKRQPNPQLSETVVLNVNLAPDVELGEHELRLLTAAGLSNPLRFCVGPWPEQRETEPNDKADHPGQGISLPPGLNGPRPVVLNGPLPVVLNGPLPVVLNGPLPVVLNGPLPVVLNGPLPVVLNGPLPVVLNGPLPVVLNGQIMPGDVDHFTFTARPGQRLVAAVKARQLIPYLADAVPGWFQATLALLDADGNEVAYVDDYGFHPDPVLYCVIPKRGRYSLQIKDAIYRGREDFVYRITVGNFPFVRSIFPSGGRADTETTVKLFGWNLHTDSLILPPQFPRAGIYSMPFPDAQRTYNRVSFAVDTLRESFEEEPNDDPGTAQPIGPPLVINGRINRPGDEDVFRFHSQSADPLVVEVLARRIDSPLDSIIKLTDAGGRQLIVNDDHLDQGAGLTTHHADSRFRIALPERGDYYLHLADSQFNGGADFTYRLRVSGQRPDFELRVVPSTINAPAGSTFPIGVYALRKDGFSDDIALALKDAPPGFSLSGGWVPAHQDKVRLTLTVPPRRQDEPVKLHLEGRAVIGKNEVCRPAIPADEMMQAFIYQHLVPARDWGVLLSKRGGRGPQLSLVRDQPVGLPAGGTARVEMFGTKKLAVNQFQFALNGPPDGITLEGVSASGKNLAIQLRADAAQTRPGLKGNVLIDVARAVGQKNAKQGNPKWHFPLGTLPAIPFEIVPAKTEIGSDSKSPVE